MSSCCGQTTVGLLNTCMNMTKFVICYKIFLLKVDDSRQISTDSLKKPQPYYQNVNLRYKQGDSLILKLKALSSIYFFYRRYPYNPYISCRHRYISKYFAPRVHLTSLCYSVEIKLSKFYALFYKQGEN